MYFVVLAMMIIMVHSIIPHHHHNDHICIELSFLAEKHQKNTEQYKGSDCCEHSVNNPTSSYGSHGSIDPFACQPANHAEHQTEHDATGNCQLIEHMVFYPAPQQETLKCPVCLLDNNIPHYFETIQAADYTLNLISGKPLPFRQHPYCPTYSQQVAGHCLGLRAPPAFS